MVDETRRLNPGTQFDHGYTLSLDVGDWSWGGIVAFCSIAHLRREVARAPGKIKISPKKACFRVAEVFEGPRHDEDGEAQT